MQRVVRSSLIGLLAIAGLTAIGDKIEAQCVGPPASDQHQVVVGHQAAVSMVAIGIAKQYLSVNGIVDALSNRMSACVRVRSAQSTDESISGIVAASGYDPARSFRRRGYVAGNFGITSQYLSIGSVGDAGRVHFAETVRIQV